MKESNFKKSTLSILLLWIIAPNLVFALITHHYTVAKLWSDSGSVVHGVVIKRSFHQDERRIYTRYQVKLNQVYKRGEIDENYSEVAIHLPGGEMSGLRQSVSGIPSLHLGGEYILFLRCPTMDRCVPLGYGQGVWTQEKDSDQWRALDERAHLGALRLQQLISQQQRTQSQDLSGSQLHSPRVEAQP